MSNKSDDDSWGGTLTPDKLDDGEPGTGKVAMGKGGRRDVKFECVDHHLIRINFGKRQGEPRVRCEPSN